MGGGPIPVAPASPFPAAAPSPAAAVPAPEAAGALPPAAVPAAEPAPEAAVSGPCACTDTGLSGGANTSTVGCGQWDLVSGSNRFTCFVVDPAGCTATGTAKLTPSDAYPGAALRSCTLDEAQSFLPTISQLLVRTPQLASFVSALRMAGLASIPGNQVTICAPSNQAFNAAVYSGKVTRDQLQDPNYLRGLIIASIVPARATLAQMVALGNVTVLDGQNLPVRTQSGGQTIVGDAGVVLPDLLSQNGIVHITDGFVAMPLKQTAAPLAERAAPSSPEALPAARAAPISPPASPPPPAVPPLVPPPVPGPPPSPVLPTTSPLSPPLPLSSPPTPSPSPSLPSPLPSPPSPSACFLNFLPAGTTGLLSAPDLLAQLAGGCACTATGRSGSVQTGEAGCAPRTDSGFFFPVSLCYVADPAGCATSLPSTQYPGAAWKLC
ncbi:hypothetical protein ABPG77_001130 [Micractinium sp. CCAP 211/92]